MVSKHKESIMKLGVSEAMSPKVKRDMMKALDDKGDMNVFLRKHSKSIPHKLTKVIQRYIDMGKKKELQKIFQKHIDESDLGLTLKKGKTVKVKHKTSGKTLVVIDKPNVRKEYEKIGYFAESVNEKVIKVSKKDDVPGNAMKMSGEEKIKKLTYSGSNGNGSYEIKGKNLNVNGIRPRDKGFFVRHFTMKTGFRKANLYYDGVHWLRQNKKFQEIGYG